MIVACLRVPYDCNLVLTHSHRLVVAHRRITRIKLSAQKLKNVERFSKSDPFVQISRMQVRQRAPAGGEMQGCSRGRFQGADGCVSG